MGAGNIPKNLSKVTNVESMLQANIKNLRKDMKKHYEPLPVLLSFMKSVEDSGLVNAGIGSNLNLDGQIELDASLVHLSLN